MSDLSRALKKTRDRERRNIALDSGKSIVFNPGTPDDPVPILPKYVDPAHPTWGSITAKPFIVVSVLPNASVDYRGYRALVEGGAGVADEMHVCVKNAGDTYEWKEIGFVP